MVKISDKQFYITIVVLMIIPLVYVFIDIPEGENTLKAFLIRNALSINFAMLVFFLLYKSISDSRNVEGGYDDKETEYKDKLLIRAYFLMVGVCVIVGVITLSYSLKVFEFVVMKMMLSYYSFVILNLMFFVKEEYKKINLIITKLNALTDKQISEQ